MADHRPGAPQGPFTAPSTAGVAAEGSPQLLRAARGFRGMSLQGRLCNLQSGLRFTASISSRELWRGAQVAVLGEGGLPPPSGATTG